MFSFERAHTVRKIPSTLKYVRDFLPFADSVWDLINVLIKCLFSFILQVSPSLLRTSSPKSGTNSPTSPMFTDEETFAEFVEDESPIQTLPKRQNKRKHDSQQDQLERHIMLKSTMQTLAKAKPSDEFDVFGQFIASNLRTWHAIDAKLTSKY